jgi:hypothetical protein
MRVPTRKRPVHGATFSRIFSNLAFPYARFLPIHFRAVGRVEANIYVAVCSNVRDDEVVARIAQRFLKQQPGVTCPIGIGPGAGDEDAETLLQRARETAMPRNLLRFSRTP